MDITNDPDHSAEPVITPAADVPLPPERPEAAPAVAAAAPEAGPFPAPPIPRHDSAAAPGFNGPRPGWWNSAEAAAASQGVNSDTLWKIAGIESAFGRNMGARPGMGPFQIMPALGTPSPATTPASGSPIGRT